MKKLAIAAVLSSCLGSPDFFAASGGGYQSQGGGTSTGTGGAGTAGGGGGTGGGGVVVVVSDEFPCPVATVLQGTCQTCHSSPPQNLAPMPLMTRADLLAQSPFAPGTTVGARCIVRMRSTGTPMPPLPYAPIPGPLIDAFDAWVTAGMPQDKCVQSGTGGGSGGTGGGGAGGSGVVATKVTVGPTGWPFPGDAGTPVLRPVCLNGWCWEQPLPMSGIKQLAPSHGDIWAIADFFAVQDLLSTPQGFIAGQQLALAGGKDDNVWFKNLNDPRALGRSADAGIQWIVPSLFPVAGFTTTGSDDVWVADGQNVARWNGAQWLASPAPPIRLLSAASRNEVWGASLAPTTATLARFDGTVWSPQPALSVTPFTQLFDLAAFAGNDVWLSLGDGVYHWNGAGWTQFTDVFGAFTGTSQNLFAVAGSRICWWDGTRWWRAPDAPISPQSQAAGGLHELYVVDANGTLCVLRGDRWLTLTSGETNVEYTGIGVPPDGQPTAVGMAPNGNFVLMRTDAGTWVRPPFPSFPPLQFGLLGVSARAQDDQWTYGYDVVHFDGQGWVQATFVPPPNAPGWTPYLTSICSFNASEAVGYSPNDGFWTWDGGSWSSDQNNARPSNPLGALSCTGPGPGEAWAAGFDTIAHREAGRWQVYAGAEAPASGLARTYSAGPHQLISAAQRAVYRSNGADWFMDPLQGLQQTVPIPISFTAVTGTSATDITFLDDTGTLHHFDGTRFDGSYASGLMNNPQDVHALGPGDVLVIDNRFGTSRVTAGIATQLVAPFTLSTDPYLQFGTGTATFFSATQGLALDGLSVLRKFDGSSWSAVTGAPLAYLLFAFSMSDIWLASDTFWHWDGAQWTELALTSPEPIRGIWGVSSNDLWVIGSQGGIWRNAGGSFVKLAPLPPGDAPAELYGLTGTSSDDVWMSGTHFTCSTGLPALYHWNGVALSRYLPPTNVSEIRLFNGSVVAAGGRRDCSTGTNGYLQLIWQFVNGAWVEAPMLDLATVFPDLVAPTPGSGPLIAGPVSYAGTQPRWAAGGNSILVRP